MKRSPAFFFTKLSFAIVVAVEITAWSAEPVPDFQLQDLNTASPRYNSAGTPVSPRDYVLQVSGYYFGHAT